MKEAREEEWGSEFIYREKGIYKYYGYPIEQ